MTVSTLARGTTTRTRTILVSPPLSVLPGGTRETVSRIAVLIWTLSIRAHATRRYCSSNEIFIRGLGNMHETDKFDRPKHSILTRKDTYLHQMFKVAINQRLGQ